jgi:hypothetical protein
MTNYLKLMHSSAIVVGGLVFLGLGCARHELRGKSVPSSDQRTYLVVDEVENSDPLLVDGKPWPYPLHKPGPIQPGVHKIQCGSSKTTGIEFEIRQGQTFHFNYWGP